MYQLFSVENIILLSVMFFCIACIWGLAGNVVDYHRDPIRMRQGRYVQAQGGPGLLLARYLRLFLCWLVMLASVILIVFLLALALTAALAVTNTWQYLPTGWFDYLVQNVPMLLGEPQ